VIEVRNVKSRLVKQQARRVAWAAALLLLLAGTLTPAWGQEAVRMSIASEQAAEAQHRAAATVGYYNLKLGPTAWNFGTGLGVQYNSNVQLVDNQPEGDFIFTPQLNTRMVWPVSDVNTINLTLGAGYSAYVKNPQLDRAYITPGSELSFNIYAGDFLINLHDRFSITADGYQDPTVAGTGYYSQLQNALGVATTWDLNKVILRSGYDHVNYEPLNSGNGQNSGGYSSGDSEVFSASAGYALKPGMLLGVELGVELGGALINYKSITTNSPYSNADQWNVGGFYEAPVSEYIHLHLHAGYTAYIPQTSGLANGSTNFGGLYASLDVTHRVNQYLAYSLSGGRALNTSFASSAVEQYFAQ
jgi:hypothetical protein